MGKFRSRLKRFFSGVKKVVKAIGRVIANVFGAKIPKEPKQPKTPSEPKLKEPKDVEAPKPESVYEDSYNPEDKFKAPWFRSEINKGLDEGWIKLTNNGYLILEGEYKGDHISEGEVIEDNTFEEHFRK